uniref:PH domain-containing protein n=1 Tax=Latimeria chalumnae TaxID=7897 RepID=H3AP29_LATCH
MSLALKGWHCILLYFRSILHRWKKNWFDLWLDGNFVYYQDESRRIIEDRIHIKFNSVGIKAGYECRGK